MELLVLEGDALDFWFLGGLSICFILPDNFFDLGWQFIFLGFPTLSLSVLFDWFIDDFIQLLYHGWG